MTSVSEQVRTQPEPEPEPTLRFGRIIEIASAGGPFGGWGPSVPGSSESLVRLN